MEAAADQPPVNVSRVQAKIPPFWPSDPELWFAQVESQFSVAQITSEATKYSYVAGNLEAQYAAEVRDILTNPPETNQFQTLKQELIKRLSSSQEQKTRRLLEQEEIGDRKPSQFLRHLQALAGSIVPDALLKSIWTSRLPANVQAILTTQRNATLQDTAELADAIMGATRVQAIQKTPMEDTLQVLLNEITHLKSQIRGRSRQRGRSSSRGRDSSSTKKWDTCWYHYRFGDKARKCQPPCKRAESGNEQGNH